MSGRALKWIELSSWANPSQRDEVRRVWASSPLSRAVSALEAEGHGCLLVGGCVRDLLLGQASKDLDLVVDATAGQLMKLKSKLRRLTGATPVPLDAQRGILRLCFAEEQELDLVARQGKDLLADLLRRDLTINAMALNAAGGLADPSGGLADLRAGLLREVRPGNFDDDPLRAVRVLRFAAQLDFQVEPESWRRTLEAIQKVNRVAGERLLVEMRKFFESAGGSALKLLREARLPEALGLATARGRWPVLEEVARTEPAGWPRGLALWLGDASATLHAADCFKLSSKDQQFLDHWRRGMQLAGEPREWSLGDVYDLAVVSGPAFLQLARTLSTESFPTSMSAQAREIALREAEGRGRLRWSKPPWDGHQLAAAMGRKPGRWLKAALARLTKAWALGQIESLQQAVELLEE